MSLKRIFLIAVIAFGAFYYHQNTKWRECTSVESGFSVKMPGIAYKESAEINTPAGAVHFFTYTVDRGDIAYAVGYAEFPPVRQSGVTNDAILESVLGGQLRRVNGKVASDNPATLGTHAGREVKIEGTFGSDAVILHVRNFMVDQKLYQLLAYVARDKDSKYTSEVLRFFQSFKLL